MRAWKPSMFMRYLVTCFAIGWVLSTAYIVYNERNNVIEISDYVKEAGIKQEIIDETLVNETPVIDKISNLIIVVCAGWLLLIVLLLLTTNPLDIPFS